MKSAAFIVAIIAIVLLGVQFFMRATETKVYKTGAGAILPLAPDTYSAAKLYGGTRPSPNAAPATTVPDSTAAATKKSTGSSDASKSGK